MATNQASVLVNKVKPHKDSWKVHVKLLHSWTQNTTYGGETLEFVLADQTGGKIHASCKIIQMFRLQRSLPPGEWRFIENFKVSASGGKYRQTPLPYKITFTSDTLIGRSVFEDDDPYPNLVSYEDIGGQGSDANVLIDIIGEVFNLDGIQIVQVHGKDRKRVHFRLRDTNGHDVRCCLWRKYAEQFEPFTEDNNVETLLCLIRLLQVNRPLAIMGTKSDNQVIKHQKTDWDDVQFRSIAEILVAIETQSEPISALDTNSSTLSSGEVLMLKPNSASLSEGFTTSTVKRKEEDAELKDITSTSKKLHTKPVKLEKTKDDTK
ncbi:hypothetical protein HID58_046045 [Brassica napus]|uniref:Replication protein A 70 kDa DNA-binding subunit B/D first OB fold domain-containing protein n=1 Tax=Brassica napus TaxID=3708 RepID=A0ABQ8AVC1_BRANA|nr:hypothetical protein HID58_046045 [Brassica napus]